MGNETWRLFFAIVPPSTAQRKLKGIQSTLKKRLASPTRGLKWETPTNLHITVTFLGDVQAYIVPEMITQATPQIAIQSPFRLQSEGLGGFPKRRPRVLWLGFAEGIRPLKVIKKALEPPLQAAPFNFELDKRRYTPHITLARAKSDAAKKTAEKLLKIAGEYQVMWEVDTVHLMRSTLTPQGAVYTVVHRFVLGKSS